MIHWKQNNPWRFHVLFDKPHSMPISLTCYLLQRPDRQDGRSLPMYDSEQNEVALFTSIKSPSAFNTNNEVRIPTTSMRLIEFRGASAEEFFKYSKGGLS